MAEIPKESTNPEFDDDGKEIKVEEKQEDKVEDEKVEEPKDEVVEEEIPEPKEEEIPVRRSALQHIIARKNEKIKKLESKEDEEEPEEKEVDIDEKIQRHLKPFQDTLVSQSDEGEVQDLYKSEPTAKKFDKAIRAYMKHPSWSGVPPEAIYHHLAFKVAEAEGAKKRDTADKEAAHTKGGGRSIMPKEKDVEGILADLDSKTDAEIEEIQTKVLQGKM